MHIEYFNRVDINKKEELRTDLIAKKKKQQNELIEENEE